MQDVVYANRSVLAFTGVRGATKGKLVIIVTTWISISQDIPSPRRDAKAGWCPGLRTSASVNVCSSDAWCPRRRRARVVRRRRGVDGRQGTRGQWLMLVVKVLSCRLVG